MTLTRLLPLTLSFLALTACGKSYTIDPAFQPYVGTWNQTYADHPVNVTVEFGSMHYVDEVGYWDEVEIVIDSKFWNETTENGRKQLLFHELGHAIFGYQHDVMCLNLSDSTDVRECNVIESPQSALADFAYAPRSIMYPYVFGMDAFYPEQEPYYLSQLSACPTCNYPVDEKPVDNTNRSMTRYRRID